MSTNINAGSGLVQNKNLHAIAIQFELKKELLSDGAKLVQGKWAVFDRQKNFHRFPLRAYLQTNETNEWNTWNFTKAFLVRDHKLKKMRASQCLKQMLTWQEYT